MWNKIVKKTQNKIEAPGLMRYNKYAKVFMPKNMAHAGRVDFYHDSKGRLAYQFKESGEYKVRINGAQAEFTLPAKLQDMVPNGTYHNIKIVVDGGLIDGMYIIDTQQFEAEDNRRVPAE